MVLGSTQPEGVVRAGPGAQGGAGIGLLTSGGGGSGSGGPGAAGGVATAGLEVVRRRSGGGAVLVEPGRLVWAEVVVPVDDPLWEADVGRASWWLGRAWAAALADLGVGPALVHEAGMVHREWSRVVCFAGLGPGEVTVGARKVVGLAQRRTRQGALFQCAVPLEWDPSPLLEMLDLTPEQRAVAKAELTASVLPITARTAAEVEAALLAHLP